MLNNVIVAWTGRRLLEVGGWVTALASFYFAMPADTRADINRIFQGDFDNVSIAAAIGIAAYIWSQVMSFRSTVRPSITTTDGVKGPLPVDPQKRNYIEEVAKTTAAHKPTGPFGGIFKKLLGKES